MAYLIDCPHCGPRTSDEFYVKGDASKARPDQIGDDTLDAWNDYVHIRDNPRGRIAEYWHHTGGCRQWMVVERHTISHEIFGVTPARDWTPGAKKKKSKTPAKKAAVRKAPAKRGRAKS